MSTAIDICDCGHKPSRHESFTTGYGTNPNDNCTYCYACCTKQDKEEIANAKPGDKICHYVNSAFTLVTNWPGRSLMRITHIGEKHNFSRYGYHSNNRRYFRAVDLQGRIWKGIGSESMYCILTLTKQTTQRS